MKPLTEQPEFDFEHALPAGKEYFSPRWLSRFWGVSKWTVERLIAEGELEVAVDLAPATSTKALQRVLRPSIVAFLERRKSGVYQRITTHPATGCLVPPRGKI